MDSEGPGALAAIGSGHAGPIQTLVVMLWPG